MWLFMTVMCALIPVAMIIFGYLFRVRMPKKINYFFGYRTNMSMINEDTWGFAHRHIGRTWVISGLILLPVSVAAMLFLLGKDADTVGKFGEIITYVQCGLLILSLIPTEVALRKTFDKNGKRKAQS